MHHPSMQFDHQLVPGSVKNAMKDAGAGSRDLWQVAPHELQPIPGFNVRVQDADYQAHIRRIADSMKTEGFIKTSLAGYVAHDGDKQVIYFYDGHSATRRHCLPSAKVPRFRVSGGGQPFSASLEDLTVALVQANNGKP